jgi:hypothetical protein
MSDKCRTENYKTNEVLFFKNLKAACAFLGLKYPSIKNYFSRNKGAKCWLSPDKTLKIEKK